MDFEMNGEVLSHQYVRRVCVPAGFVVGVASGQWSVARASAASGQSQVPQAILWKCSPDAFPDVTREQAVAALELAREALTAGVVPR